MSKKKTTTKKPTRPKSKRPEGRRYSRRGHPLVSREDLLDRKMALYAVFLSKVPPRELVILEEKRMEVPGHLTLQDFICDNLRHEFAYATGISILEAVDAIVISQVENGGEDLDAEELPTD